MPTTHGFRVIVETFDSETFTEYGTKTHRAPERTISTKIESRADTKFRIRIQAIGPFPSLDSNVIIKEDNPFYRHRSNGSSKGFQPPLWDVEATVYIDGVHHDSKVHKLGANGAASKGAALMSHRCSKEATGAWRRWNWIFSEAGVETLLSQLDITSSPPAAGIEAHSDSPSSKQGTIEVHLCRFVQTSGNTAAVQILPGDAGCEKAERLGNGNLPPADSPHFVTLMGADGKNERWNYGHGEKLDDREPYAKFIFQ
jgi:hypothetical protein